MHVLALRLDLRFAGVSSLKEKRARLRPLIDGGRHRFPVAMSEVDHQDLWQRAALGIAAVSGSATHVVETIDAVERFVWSFPDVEVLEAERRWLEAE